MSLTVLHFALAALRLAACTLLFTPLVGALVGCDGANKYKAGQLESKASTFLPDGSGILFIETDEPEGLGGQLSLLDVATEKHSVLYSANSSNDLRMRQPIWGDLNCDESERFSPQSFDLMQRPSGRWQLLLVNQKTEGLFHISDTVEMFELLRNDLKQWGLIWRGCVEAPAGIVFHEVKGLQDGFLLTPALTFYGKIISLTKAVFAYEAEKKWRWRLRDGFQLVPVVKAAASKKTDSKD
jgi:hypothetical protein